jgi:hypothetical protein
MRGRRRERDFLLGSLGSVWRVSGDFEYRVGRGREAWETSASGPYVTIRPGGPLDGLVTLTATGSDGRVIVEASWGVPQRRSSATAERVGHAAADDLARAWANELALGRAPRAD